MAAQLEGRVAVVTGGGRGIGRAVALDLARQGARVLVNDLGSELDGTGSSHEPADSVVAEIRDVGGQAQANYADVSEYDAAKGVIDAAVEAFGRIDILANSVGNARPKLLVDCSQEDLDILIDVMLKGKLYTTQHAARRMIEQRDGVIVNIASNMGLVRMARRVAYGAAQVGIIGFSNIAAVELGPYGVRVNTICPGATESRLIRDAIRIAQEEPDHPIAAATEGGNRTIKPDPPEDLATFLTYLCTPAAKDVNGQFFYVSGGHIALCEGMTKPRNIYKDGHWTIEELTKAVPKTLTLGIPNPAPRSIP